MQYFNCYFLSSQDSSLKIDVYQSVLLKIWLKCSVLFSLLFPLILRTFNNMLRHVIHIFDL